MNPQRPLLAALALSLALTAAGCGDSADALMAKARSAIAAREPKAAEIHLKNLLRKQERADARLLLGQVHAASGDWRSAEKEFERALEANHDPVAAGLGLAETRLQLGEWRKVIEQLAKLPPGTPADTARAQTLLGRAHAAGGQREAAQAAYQAALQAAPDHVPARVGLITLSASRDLNAAQSAVDELLARAPDAPDALSLKGDIELAAGRVEQASALYARVAKAEPLNRSVRAKLASLASEQRDYAGAQRWIDELKKLTGPAVGTMHLQALNDFRQNRLEPARDAIMAGLKNSPDYLPSLALAATIHLSLNSLEQAENNARQVLERAPNSTLGYRLLAATYLRMDAPERALQVMAPVLERDVKDPLLLSLAGEASLRIGDAARSAQLFSRAATLAPDDPSQKTGRGVARIAAGDRDGGMLDLEQAAELNPSGIQPDLALIAQLLRDRQYDKASAAIERLARKQPGNPLADNLRGTIALARNDPAAARRHFEAALTKQPGYFAAVSNLAALDLRDKQPQAAQQRYLKLLEREPRHVRAMHALAQIAANAGDQAQTLQWLVKARDADRSSVPATLALARFHLAANQPKEALPILQEAAGAAPNQLELLEALGNAYLGAGDEAQAVLTFEKMLRARPDSALLQMRMAEFRMKRGEPEKALASYRKAAELSPKAVEPRAGMAGALVAMGKVTEARAIADALQRESPRSPAGALLEGDILAQQRRLPEAVAAYRRALALNRSVPIALRLHGALLAEGRQAEADAMMRGLLTEHPRDAALKMHAAMIEGSRKRWDAAVPLYREAAAIQPGNAMVLNNLAWALIETRDPTALATAEKAHALAPRSPEVLDTYGTALLARGDAARASEILRQAVSAAPRVPAYRVRLAEALIARGDKVEARKELDTVLAEVRTGPTFEQAQGLLRRL
jgi:putative PEP-CTERM system TPR-repeat lipoprotein